MGVQLMVAAAHTASEPLFPLDNASVFQPARHISLDPMTLLEAMAVKILLP